MKDSSSETPWAIKLFDKSPLKQEKLLQITSLIGDTAGLTCLDIGSDNGVISYMLRQRGGEWSSVDLIETTVESIKSLVQDRVYKIDQNNTPFEDETFDLIIIVDFLEHIETDKEFLHELSRILKPEGTLVINVPNPKEGILRKIRFMLGQTDEKHGHVRPGYDSQALKEIMPSEFTCNKESSYSRLFSVLIDMFITGGLDLLGGGQKGKKGKVVTGKDMKKMEKSFKLYSLLYPFFQIMVFLDHIFSFLHGNMYISRWKKQ